MPAPDIGNQSRQTPAYDRSRETLACGSHPRSGQHPGFDERRARLAAARLYMVCDSKPGGRELTSVLRAAIAGGVDIVQLRDKHLSDEELTEVVRTAHKVCEQMGALLIVNDRPKVALAAGADGVHVGQEDTPVAEVRELVGPHLLIGLSTHAPAEIDHAGMANADYVGVGPVYTTPTKPGRPAVGLELVRYAAEHSRLPFFAIGGIDEHNIEAAIEAGAQRVAMVRAIADAADPEVAARTLRKALDFETRSRTELKDEQARAALQPLAEGERPKALLVAVMVAALVAIGVAVGALTIHNLRSRGGSAPGGIFIALVLGALAVGMYQRRYWAVLGFEALLAFQILVTSLALVIATTILAAAACLLSIGLGGWLFWKLVRVMGRMQAGERALPHE
jgi:thiamine-phosphate pyrophosphorylase